MSGGRRGACPPEYGLVRAARYLGVNPWDLADRPAVWRDWALEFEAAEAWAEAELQKRCR